MHIPLWPPSGFVAEDETNTAAATARVLSVLTLREEPLKTIWAMCNAVGLPYNGRRKNALCRSLANARTISRVGRALVVPPTEVVQLTGRIEPVRTRVSVESAMRAAGVDPYESESSACLLSGLLSSAVPFGRHGELELDYVVHSSSCLGCDRCITLSIRDLLSNDAAAVCDGCGTRNHVHGICSGRSRFGARAGCACRNARLVAAIGDAQAEGEQSRETLDGAETRDDLEQQGAVLPTGGQTPARPASAATASDVEFGDEFNFEFPSDYDFAFPADGYGDDQGGENVVPLSSSLDSNWAALDSLSASDGERGGEQSSSKMLHDDFDFNEWCTLALSPAASSPPKRGLKRGNAAHRSPLSSLQASHWDALDPAPDSCGALLPEAAPPPPSPPRELAQGFAAASTPPVGCALGTTPLSPRKRPRYSGLLGTTAQQPHSPELLAAGPAPTEAGSERSAPHGPTPIPAALHIVRAPLAARKSESGDDSRRERLQRSTTELRAAAVAAQARCRGLQPRRLEA
jgi:hypothetical protein